MDAFAILGVPPDASAEQLSRVFKALSKIYHPDNADTGNQEHFIRLREAYDTAAGKPRVDSEAVDHTKAAVMALEVLTKAIVLDVNAPRLAMGSSVKGATVAGLREQRRHVRKDLADMAKVIAGIQKIQDELNTEHCGALARLLEKRMAEIREASSEASAKEHLLGIAIEMVQKGVGESMPAFLEGFDFASVEITLPGFPGGAPDSNS